MHNGDCVGADEQVGKLWQEIGGKIDLHPPENASKRAYLQSDHEHEPLPYLVRNRAIVDASEILLGFSGTDVETLRSGTWSTIRYARKRHIRRAIFYPDGRTAWESN